jgi:hypothetical protein
VISGRILGSDLQGQSKEFQQGDTVVFAVQDNGEGGDDVDWLSPLASIPDWLPDACLEIMPPIETTNGGNVQVQR